MYAIIEVGGKQYKVKEKDVLDVEKQVAEEGKEIDLNKVLLLSNDKKVEIGQPYVKGAKVVATVIKQTKAPKVVSFKYKRRKSTHWKKGHRQQITRLEIKDIILGS